MAKITARGGCEVAAVNATAETINYLSDNPSVVKVVRYRFVLRSDGVILRRERATGSQQGTGYSRFAKLKPSATRDLATLKRVVRAMGCTPDD